MVYRRRVQPWIFVCLFCISSHLYSALPGQTFCSVFDSLRSLSLAHVEPSLAVLFHLFFSSFFSTFFSVRQGVIDCFSELTRTAALIATPSLLSSLRLHRLFVTWQASSRHEQVDKKRRCLQWFEICLINFFSFWSHLRHVCRAFTNTRTS